MKNTGIIPFLNASLPAPDCFEGPLQVNFGESGTFPMFQRYKQPVSSTK